MCRDYAGTSEKVWRTPLNWAFVIRLHEHLNVNSFCFYSLDFKAIFFLLCGSLWQRVPLENRQKMFLMKAEPRAVRGAIRVPSFVCHKKSRLAWQAFGPINNAWEELHPPWCQEKGTAEKRLCYTTLKVHLLPPSLYRMHAFEYRFIMYGLHALWQSDVTFCTCTGYADFHSMLLGCLEYAVSAWNPVRLVVRVSFILWGENKTLKQ